MKKLIRSQNGFTFVQVLISVVVLAIAATVALKVSTQGTTEAKIIESIEEILDLQRAIYGDTRLADQTDFGFVGDLGRLPTSLEELIENINDDPLWDGPYVKSDFTDEDFAALLDAWGNLYDYDNTSGQITIAPESVGDEPILIPEQITDVDKILYGNIQGSLRDMFDNQPKIGDRKHILIWMEPIFDENNWPELIQNIERDKLIFHFDRSWHNFHSAWNVLHWFSESTDRGRDHWKTDWEWRDEDEDDDDDDHEDEFDNEGKKNRFDEHFPDYWKHFVHEHDFDQDFLSIKVFIHPDKQGNYSLEKIPIRPYIITAYHDKLEMSVKQYVIIRPNRTAGVSFKFNDIFPGYHVVEDEEENGSEDISPMADRLEVESDFIIDSTTEDDITLSNESDSAITINEMKVKWSDSSNSQKVKSISINGVEVWSGSKRSNQTINIDDTVISSGAENIPVTLEFSTNLGDRTFELTFVMSDGTEILVN